MKSRKVAKCIGALLLLGHVLMFLYGVVVENLRLRYLYFSLKHTCQPILYTVVVVLVIPSLVYVASIFVLKLENKIVRWVTFTICLLILVIWYTLTIFLCLFLRGGVASHTSDVNHLGNYDPFVAEMMAEQGQEDYLPSKVQVPDKSRCEYYYCYDYGIFNEFFIIELSVSFDRQGYEREMERLSARELESRDNMGYRIKEIGVEEFCVAYLPVKEKNTIHYLVTFGQNETEQSAYERLQLLAQKNR